MLPWDEWGPMADSYHGKTGADFDETIDAVASAACDLDHDALQHHYDRLAVPPAMIT
jgi:hypothetical protein